LFEELNVVIAEVFKIKDVFTSSIDYNIVPVAFAIYVGIVSVTSVESIVSFAAF